MTSVRPLEWTAASLEKLAALLKNANGRRRARTLDVAQVQAVADQARTARHRYAWHHGGSVEDARELTTLCLAVVTDAGCSIGIASVRAIAPIPDRAWSDLTEWDRYVESVNIAKSQHWAHRRHDDVFKVAFVEASPDFSSEESLMQAILDDPSDDTARLMMADFLSDRGDPRGEFISVQCELEKLGREGARGQLLQERERALLELHGEEWIRPLSEITATVAFRRGFPASVALFFADSLEKEAAFFEKYPVTQLKLLSTKGIDMHALALQPWLSRVTSLSFEGKGYGVDRLNAENMHSLLESRRLRQVRELAFRGHRIDNMGALVLAKNAPGALPSLESLTLADDEVSEIGVQGLMSERWSGALTTLDLSHNELRAGGAEAIAMSRFPGKLKTLKLDANSLGDTGARAIAAAPRLDTLRTLSLAGNNIGTVGIEALLASPFLKHLKDLELKGNNIGTRVRPLYERRFKR